MTEIAMPYEMRPVSRYEYELGIMFHPTLPHPMSKLTDFGLVLPGDIKFCTHKGG